eukprot:GEMP01118794.1.p1 GENE.GEMP01118794.1~~GEMP01118794.1.p1  ORF type:complete len:181 (-),score=0.61 GEMP01118794.1:36-578(-)
MYDDYHANGAFVKYDDTKKLIKILQKLPIFYIDKIDLVLGVERSQSYLTVTISLPAAHEGNNTRRDPHSYREYQQPKVDGARTYLHSTISFTFKLHIDTELQYTPPEESILRMRRFFCTTFRRRNPQFCHPCACVGLPHGSSYHTLEEGRIMTCRLPRFSALTILFKQSRSTLTLTMMGV